MEKTKTKDKRRRGGGAVDCHNSFVFNGLWKLVTDVALFISADILCSILGLLVGVCELSLLVVVICGILDCCNSFVYNGL